MNKIFLSHTSAFLIYRAYRNSLLALTLNPSNCYPSDDYSFNAKSILHFKTLTENLLPDKVDIMVTNSNCIHKNKCIKFHSSSIKYPKNAFIQIQDGIYIASPELLFLQMAETLSYENLFLFGLELCGTYSILKSDRGFISNVEPLTNSVKISKFVYDCFKSHKNLKGKKNLKVVVERLKDFSASPQESRLFIVLTSPRKLGGFDIKNLEFNKQIKLSSSANKICGKSYIVPDICNPKNKLAIEYDSDAFHDNEQNRIDKQRLDAYICDNWTTYTFVSNQMHNAAVIKNLCLEILKKNAQSSRIRIKDFDIRLNNLLRRLYA